MANHDSNNTREIALSGLNGIGLVALVDAADYERLSKTKWHVKNCGKLKYAETKINGRNVYMHRLLLNAQKGQEVDHENRDSLDNRRSNLRVCTRAENGRNVSKPATNTSGVKGVSWSKKQKRWRAVITLGGKSIELGSYDDPAQAASAYATASKELHGEFGFAEAKPLSISLSELLKRLSFRKRNRGTKSRFKGMCFVKGKWRATITIDGKAKLIGTFATEEEAARAFDKAARERDGVFAVLNFPKGEVMQQIQRPTIGDIIHVIGADNNHWPALVQVVHDTPGLVDAWVFMRHSSGPERRATYCEPMSTKMVNDTLMLSPAEPKTWHWPEVDQPESQQAPDETPVIEAING